MHCRNCGNIIDSDSNYCEYCGVKVNINNKKNVFTIIVLLLIILIVFKVLFSTCSYILKVYDNLEKKTIDLNDNYYNNYDYGLDDYRNYYDNEDSYNFDTSFNEINVSDFINLKNSSNLSTIYIGDSKDKECIRELIYLYSLKLKYSLDINYLDLSNVSSDDFDKLKQSDDYFEKEFNLPVILIVKNGEIIDKLEGVQDTYKLLYFFQDNGLI